MNKSESKYFNTALKMDKAFLELLEHKDFEYITVKEICEKAGVNRSTFYLHYETVSDLLSESVQYITEQFLSYMKVSPYSDTNYAEKALRVMLLVIYCVRTLSVCQVKYLAFVLMYKINSSEKLLA